MECEKTKNSNQVCNKLFIVSLIFPDTISSEEFEEEENTILNATSEDPSNMELYEISDSTRQVLQQKGITKFFPIQYSTYDLIYNGSDMIARGILRISLIIY